MPSFPMTHAQYRKAINFCIAAVLFVAIGQQYFHINSWLVAGTLISATGLALALRFFCSYSEAERHANVSVEMGESRAFEHLPALMHGRGLPAVWSKSDYTNLAALYIANLEFTTEPLSADREIANQLLSRLLTHRSMHQKIPQTERIRQVLLDEFEGYENPWMKDVAIGAVNLRIRGDFVELHVIPTRKQVVRDEAMHSRIFPDIPATRSFAH